MDEHTPQQSTPYQSARVDELDKAFVADLIEQPKQLDKLARLVLILSFVVPVLYAIGLKFFSDSESAPSGLWFIVLAFASWFVSKSASYNCFLTAWRRFVAGGVACMPGAVGRYNDCHWTISAASKPIAAKGQGKTHSRGCSPPCKDECYLCLIACKLIA